MQRLFYCNRIPRVAFRLRSTTNPWLLKLNHFVVFKTKTILFLLKAFYETKFSGSPFKKEKTLPILICQRFSIASRVA